MKISNGTREGTAAETNGTQKNSTRELVPKISSDQSVQKVNKDPYPGKNEDRIRRKS